MPLPSAEVLWDFEHKHVVYTVKKSGTTKERIEQMLSVMEEELEASRLQVKVEPLRRGKLRLTFSGPAVDHLFRALPVLGAPIRDPRVADIARERHDRQWGESTTVWARDIDRLAHHLATGT